MGKIIVNRKHQWNNRLRQIGIYVDGKKIGTIANGEIKTFEIPDGNHTLKARIDWCGSREVDFLITGDEKKYFTLSGYKLAKIIFPYAIGVFILNFIINIKYKSDYLVWLLLPALVVIFYYLTIGRNDYLTLKQTETW